MKASLVRATELHTGGRRLEASYHASEGGNAQRILRRWVNTIVSSSLSAPPQKWIDERAEGQTRRLDRLREVCTPGGVFIPGRFRRVYVDDPVCGWPWLSPSDMLRTDLGITRWVSRKFTPDPAALRLRSGWILLSRSGTIGNVVYVRQDMEDLTGSDDIIRIVADPARIHPGYLYTFLANPLGKALIAQNTYGAVVPHIEAHHVAGLPVPRLGTTIEADIHDLVEQAAKLRIEANKLLTEATTKVLQCAGLRRLAHHEALTKGCWCFSLPRGQYGEFALTAWTYNPVTGRISEQVRAGDYRPLGELVLPRGIYYGHQFKRLDADPSRGIRLLSQAQVFQDQPQGRWISTRSVPDYREYMVGDGIILVAAQGTMGEGELFGHCQFSRRNFENRMITQHILRVAPNPERVNPGYLFAFLSSEYGFQLLRSTACGTKLLGFILGLVERIPIPLARREIQDEIGGMVYKAYDNRADALQLENQAQALLTEALTAEAAT